MSGATVECCCGVIYHVTAEQIRDGTWRRCPVCLPTDAADDTEDTHDGR